MKKERLLDVLALLLALSGLMITAWVSDDVFERIPHLEDEFAYLWQAEVMAEGQISQPSPENPKAFLIPFVIDHEGQRFAKYPPGWPAALSIGSWVNIPWLVNSLLASFSLWLIYRLGTKILGRGVGRLAGQLARYGALAAAIGVWNDCVSCRAEYFLLYSCSGLGDARSVPDHA